MGKRDHTVTDPRYSNELLKSVVGSSKSFLEVIRKLGLSRGGAAFRAVKSRVISLGLDTSHFLGVRVNSGPNHKGGDPILTPDKILVMDRRDGRKEKVHVLRRALLASRIEERCKVCSIGTMWNGKPIRLQIDHCDGNPINNTVDNLRFLCPNCHSQTDTYGSRNIGKYERSSITLHPKSVKKLVNVHCNKCSKEFQRRSSRVKKTNYCNPECFKNSSHKIDWPTLERLNKLAQSMPMTHVALQLGVSTTAILRRLRSQALVTQLEEVSVSKAGS